MNEQTMWLADNNNLEIRTYDAINPIANIQLLHGMAEHIGRYDAIAKKLQSAGFNVIMHNHLGHGFQINKATRGDFDSIATLVNHAEEIFESAHCPHIPNILIGHSMGSIVARRYVQMYPQKFDALILSGTGYFGPKEAISKRLLSLVMILTGKKTKLKLTNELTIQMFNKKFKPLETSSDWLSMNKDNVNCFINDPYAGFLMSNRALYAILNGMQASQKRKEINKMKKRLPILLVSGEDDAFGDFGRGVKRVAKLLSHHSTVDVQLYESARHEILFESNSDEVLERIMKWIKGVI